MLFQHELVYDAGIDRVYAMLADPAFREAVCAAQGVVSAQVDLESTGVGFTLTVDQLQPTDDLPSFARTFAGESTRAVQREHWEDGSGGTLKIETPGKPTEMTGTITLRPEGSRTVEIVELHIRAKVPLIGGRLEKLLAEKVKAGMDTEHGVGTAWLKEKA